MTDHDRHDDLGADGPGGGSSDDVESLLVAYALDALDDVERRRVERLLSADLDLKAEADRLTTATDHLAEAAAATGPAAPAGLWDSIASRLDVTSASSDGASPAAVVAGPLDAGYGRPAPAQPAGNVVSLADRTPRRRAGWLVGAAAAAVLLVVGSVAVGSRLSQDDTDPIVAMQKAAEEAAGQPGSRTGELVDTDATMGVPVVVDTDGHAYLMTEQLPTLAPGQTYQLWSVDGGTPVSLGLVGTDSPMTVVGVDRQVMRLALTLEPAGGSAAPTSIPMASGELSEV